MAFSRLANPSATRAVLEEHGLAAKHRMGQNFLVSDAVVGRILGLAELGREDVVLEVGPGIGTLTCALLSQAGAVVAIEADPALAEVTRQTCAGEGRLVLVEGDALRVGADELGRACAQVAPGAWPSKLVSNLPYQVAATLVLRCLVGIQGLRRAVVMVQAEVADRMAASPSTKAYGAYTVKLALVGEVSGRFEVAPSCFVPAPHVGSSVVRIERRVATDPATGSPLTPEVLADACRVVDAAFSQRRKTIRNSMLGSGYPADALDTALAASSIDPRVRAEALRPDDLLRLSSELRKAL